jgi:hypothetical protein
MRIHKQTFILDSHRFFICNVLVLIFVLKGWDGGGGHGQGEEANERLHGVVQGPEKDIRYCGGLYCNCVVRIVYGACLTV